MGDKMLEISNHGGNGQFNIIHKIGIVPENPDGGDKELAVLICFWLLITKSRKNQQCVCFYQNIIVVKNGAVN